LALNTYSPSPEREAVSLVIKDAGLVIKNWISYRYNENFLTPTDAFSFVLEDAYFDAPTKEAVIPGAKVSLIIEGNVQCTGYIDSVEKHASRGSGTVWTINGRDVMGQALDSNIDPTSTFKAALTLDQFLASVFAPFSWGAITSFAEDNVANRGVISGQKRGTPTSKKGKPLKKFILHQLRPYAREGAYEFAARVCLRQGLWIWPTADGQQLVVGTPDFEQSPITLLQRLNDGKGTNVLEGSVKYDASNQPNIILADGGGGGGEFGHSKLQAYMINPAVQYRPMGSFSSASAAKADKEFAAFTARFPGAQNLLYKHPYAFAPLYTPTLRVMYLHDDESKTPDELSNYIHREMALKVRQSLSANYTVYGHGQSAPDGSFTPWTVNTVVDVQDEVGGLSEPMWILGRTFNKSRRGGTTTDLELIRLYSLEG